MDNIEKAIQGIARDIKEMRTNLEALDGSVDTLAISTKRELGRLYKRIDQRVARSELKMQDNVVRAKNELLDKLPTKEEVVKQEMRLRKLEAELR